jgi:hypothetical protein
VGPCALENEDRALEIEQQVDELLLEGGAAAGEDLLEVEDRAPRGTP